MVEGDHIPSELIIEVAGKPRAPQPITIYQQANLDWWDNRIKEIGENLDKEKKPFVSEWDKRQFNA